MAVLTNSSEAEVSAKTLSTTIEGSVRLWASGKGAILLGINAKEKLGLLTSSAKGQVTSLLNNFAFPSASSSELGKEVRSFTWKCALGSVHNTSLQCAVLLMNAHNF